MYEDATVIEKAPFEAYLLFQANLPQILRHTPAGASVRQLIHFGQSVRYPHFRQFDHGARENRRRYGSQIPPDYRLSSVRVPVALISARNDWLSSREDVERLFRTLPNVVERNFIDNQFNHLDLVWAPAAVEIYRSMVNTMARAEQNQL